MQHATLTGIVVPAYYPRVRHAMMELGGWIAASRLKTPEEIVHRLDKSGEAFDTMLSSG